MKHEPKMARRLDIGVRVRFIGQRHPFNDVTLLLLVGRTGKIVARSSHPRMDWSVEMDEGCFDLEAHHSPLVPIDDTRDVSRECNARDDVALIRA